MNVNFKKLANQLDIYLTQINGEADEFYSQFNHIELMDNVVVAYGDNSVAIGSGAMKPYVEIKRMFVPIEFRGKGAIAMLGELESWVAELGFSRCILETGTLMKDEGCCATL